MNHHASTQPPLRRFTLTEAGIIVAVLLVLAIIAGMFLPVLSTARGKQRCLRCPRNLKEIGMATLMYTGDHAGFFMNVNPWGFGDAANPCTGNWQPLGTLRYIADSDSGAWACPCTAAPRSDCDSSNYLYYGSGLKDDNDMATATVIGFDASGNHKNDEWMNALFIDGHAEGAKPDGTKGWNRNSRPPRPAPAPPTASPPTSRSGR